MKKIVNKITSILAVMAISSAIFSCKKGLDVPYPTNSINSESAFTSMGTIDGMMSQLYIYFNQWVANDGNNIWRTLAAVADEGYNPTTYSPFIETQTNNITPTSTYLGAPSWDFVYKTIYWANSMLNGIPGASAAGFTDDKKKAYMAAAKTVRAYAYFQLVRAYGDVPLITGTDVPANATRPRDPAATVYAAIEKDLQEAIAALPATLSTKYFINNKYIPEALLAEVYLTQGKWALAEAAATDIIGSNKYQLSAVTDAFVQSSTETIFATAPVYSSTNAAISFKVGNICNTLLFPEGAPRILYEGASTSALSPSLLNSFEASDLRLANWVVLRNQAGYANPNNRMFPYKYKYSHLWYTGTIPAGREEDNKIIRLAEIYLLRAEARAQQGANLTGAAADINMIRTRAGLSNTTAATQTSLVDAVLDERRHELFMEGGYRWFDLVRTGRINTVLSALSYKVNWKPYMKLFPLTPTTLAANPNLIQTPGY